MSARSTYLLVDNSYHSIEEDVNTLTDISRFVYEYLINPIVFNKSNKVSLLKYPQSINDIDNKPLDWYTITSFMSKLDYFNPDDSIIDLLSILTDILQSISFTATKLKNCDLILISAFDSNYNWDYFGIKIKNILNNFNNINLIIIDTMSLNSKNIYHNKNIENLISIINDNENNQDNNYNYNNNSYYYKLNEAKLALEKFEFLIPNFKKPTEIYSFTLQILGIPDLEFNISAYPFTKKTGLSDYIKTTTINVNNFEKIKNKYQFYYDERNKNGEIEQKEIQNYSFITEAYNFGTSNLLITDLPNNIFNLNSIKSMIITSFVPETSIAPWYLKQDSLIILPSNKKFKINKGLMDKDYAIFCELWKSMLRLRVIGTVRYVKKNGSDIKYGLLYPQGYIDKEIEKSGNINFGCFIFIETIFKDDEKLVNLPDLLKMKIDSKLEIDIDNMVDSFRLDKDDDPIDDNDDIKDINACVVSMNEIPNNDIFYQIRQYLQNTQINNDNEINPTILTNRISNILQKYNNPLMLIERLIYVISYIVLKNHLSQSGDDDDQELPLYKMYQEQGFPDKVVELWIKNAKEGNIFSFCELNIGNPTTKRAFTTHLSYDKTRNRLIYPSGKCVILRSLNKDGENWVFNNHKFNVTVAKISPSGYYIASGDEGGNVLIWDCSQPEMILKSEFKILSNKINDLAWDADSKRIIAVGNGSDTFGHCFTFDSGNSIGEISGHSSQINSVAIKTTRPYSAFTVGDDSNVVFLKGPPFKFNSSNKIIHNNFIKMIKYSPNGKIAVSVGVDRIIALFDGNTGELINSFKDLSKGGIYSVDWINDETFIIASADAYLRKLNIEGKILNEWSLKYQIESQFLGCIVIDNDKFIGLTLGGSFYIFNDSSKDPIEIIDAHQVSITAMTKFNENDDIFTGSYDGKILKHTDDDDLIINGDNHHGLVVSIEEILGTKSLFSISWDDKLKLINERLEISTIDELNKQPIDLKINSKFVTILFEDEIKFFDFNGKVIKSIPLNFEASSIDISEKFIIITDSKNFQIHIYDLEFNSINESNFLRSKPTVLSISQNEEYLACGDIQGKILLYSLKDFSLITSRWAFHTSKINSIKWSPNGLYCLSGSLDTNIFIYSVEKPSRNIKFLNAHKEGVNCVEWLDENTIVSAGSDSCIKYWDVKY
ncbi:WD40 repeat-like protein [Pichia californica]|nr:WD40 repeat-like protein [[Candida] californica]